ncbi:thermonuclease family protein [Lentzea sp. NPDC006480]|uniref:thermonuclease family protein n=1 Tax=Lentzea sp. NPDC006480 TaxID=3157176 RepID=UPI0033A6C249
MSLGVLAALATTVAAGFAGGANPQQRVDAGADPMRRGDSFEVTVHMVSDVDLFEGVEPASGVLFRARVAGIGRIADCWLAESRATAQNLLRGKMVRLTVKKDVDSDSDRIVVDVQLPDGADYANTLVHDGMAPADVSTRDELAQVETVARQEHRGLWASSCLRIVSTTSSVPASSTTTTTTTTATTTTTPETSTRKPPPRPPVTSVEPPPDPPDDFWLGKICFKEGAKRKAAGGGELVCARSGTKLRWRRAD